MSGAVRTDATILSDREARMALTCVVEPGDVAIAILLDKTDPESVWRAVAAGELGLPMARRAAAIDLVAVRERANRCGARFLAPGDTEWPEQLDDLAAAEAVQRLGGVPIGLWVRGPGQLASMLEQSVAIVGSRASSSYGEGVAGDLASELAERGVTIVSGGAFGIDAAAHRGALAARGRTIAVLACGVDVPYPRSNAALFDWLAKDHLLVSELAPGSTPTRVRFLSRNRLIAAFSQGTVIVEAAARSGAKNTATWATECNRQLMAVPGPVHSALSVGPHQLIRDGRAVLVTSADEVLELISEMGESLLTYERGKQRPTDSLDPGQLAVFEALPARGWLSVSEIALSAGVTIPVCLAALGALETSGMVSSDERGWRIAH